MPHGAAFMQVFSPSFSLFFSFAHAIISTIAGMILMQHPRASHQPADLHAISISSELFALALWKSP